MTRLVLRAIVAMTFSVAAGHCSGAMATASAGTAAEKTLAASPSADSRLVVSSAL